MNLVIIAHPIKPCQNQYGYGINHRKVARYSIQYCKNRQGLIGLSITYNNRRMNAND